MFRELVDLIFPPLCRFCKERCRTKVLCPDCWELCAPPDPIGRCRHCFEPLFETGLTCTQCRKAPHLTAVRAYPFAPESPARLLGLDAPDAMASFLLLQWIQLEWPLPDLIIPMPDSEEIGDAFAHLINAPFAKVLKSRENYLDEDLILLLIDISNPIEDLKEAISFLSEAFPKRIYLLSLYPYAFPIS